MIQRILGSFAIAFFLLIDPCVDLVESQWSIRYHSAVPLAPLVYALLLDLAILTSVALLVMFAARRLHIWSWLRIVLAAWLPVLLARRIGLLSGHELSSWLADILVAAAILALVYLSRKRAQAFAALMRSGSVIIACMGASALMFLPTMLRIAHWSPAQPIAIRDADTAAPSRPHARIVVIVFDELSYEQTFGNRPPGLDLPAFDALRRDSVTYDNVQPIGDKTDHVLPSLLIGKTIEALYYSWSNHLYYQLPESPQWLRFNAADTFFAPARARGWHTGVVGWFNPYCSLLTPYLDSCYWADEDMDKPAWNLDRGQSALSGAVTSLGALFGSHRDKEFVFSETARARRHLLSYQELYPQALRLAADNRIDLMFLHMPVPHYPNVYDRHTGQFTLHNNSYADNLALADRTLAGIMAELQQSPRWPDTTVIVCGDHSWRTTWWRPTRYWTTEDERISHGGHFDPRPVMMVHFAGETRPFLDREAMSLMEVHQLVVDLVSSGHVQLNMPDSTDVQAMPSQTPNGL